MKLKKNDWRYWEAKRKTLREKAAARKLADAKNKKHSWSMDYLSARERKNYEKWGLKWYALKYGTETINEAGIIDTTFFPGVEKNDYLDWKWEQNQKKAPFPRDIPGTLAYNAIRAVDTHTEVSYAYCQAGHVHCYKNGELETTKVWRGNKTKHFPFGTFTVDAPQHYENSIGLKDKTVKKVDYCGD